MPSTVTAKDAADAAPAIPVEVAGTASGPGRPRRDGSGSRLRALDGLRIVAALMVCLYHYIGKQETGHAWGSNPNDLFPHLSRFAIYGCLGVQFFFVISGFVICMSTWGKTVGEFFRSRVSRLYPAYWVAIVLTAAACVLLPSVIKPLRLDEVLVNFTMLQQPAGVRRVLGVCWTLWVEARFYLLFALFVVWKGVNYRRVVVFCCLWTVAAVLATVADTPLTDEIAMPGYAPFFIGGLALYLIHRYGGDLLLWGIVAVSWLLGQHVATAGLWRPDGAGLSGERSPYVILLFVTLAFAAVAAIALGWLRWADWRWLTVAGALTYPFYLVHEHLGWFAITVLHRHAGFTARETLATSVVGMLLLAYAIHRLVEKPLGLWLKRAMTAQAARVRAATRARA
jgi:peptidoglycan/LPS O-acetylase OafA/YrhL